MYCEHTHYADGMERLELPGHKPKILMSQTSGDTPSDREVCQDDLDN